LAKVAVGGIMEVEAGRFPAENAKKVIEVKDFAAKMLLIIPKANTELKKFLGGKKGNHARLP